MSLSLFGTRLLADLRRHPSVLFMVGAQQVRQRKHWAPKWRKLRALKVIKVDLPNFQQDVSKMSEVSRRIWMRKHGIVPRPYWMEKPFTINSTSAVLDPYVPPEGDGKISPIHVQGAKQKMMYLEKRSKSLMGIRKIRQFEDQFDTPEFCQHAQKLYVRVHELLAAGKLDELAECCSERAYPELIHNTQRKTIHWKLIKTLELPRIVQARTTHVFTRENVFAQLTVRFHTQQILAIYDRFGRLVLGSEIVAKDVLEYVVFEKHLANEYGMWRIHAKIIPDWLPKREPTPFTHRVIHIQDDDDEELNEEEKHMGDGASAEPEVAVTESSLEELPPPEGTGGSKPPPAIASA